MTTHLTIALSQQNFTVGDISGNLVRIRREWERARADKADLLVLSECCISGYPMEDLALKPAFQRAVRMAVHQLAAQTRDGPALLVSAPWAVEGALYNASMLLAQGEIKAIRYKHNLPNYGVFDEKRVFDSGPLPEPIPFQGLRLGVMICEDLWQDEVAPYLCARGADILIAMNGSPYEIDKPGHRHHVAERRVFETALPFVYVNQYGGQDELVFDGLSFVLDHQGNEIIRMEDFEADYCLTHWEKHGDRWHCTTSRIGDKCGQRASIWQAMMLGLRDYVEKNGFKGVILGLSGGIDSAVSAAVAVDALGPERVRGVVLPSRYTSQMSRDDATALAENLGISLETVPIEPMFETMRTTLAALFQNLPEDTTEENMQARIRAILLMAMSNKFDHMVLTTGNKSEMSVGYATLYGDMCGGYSVLKDVYKTTVYALARWRNETTPKNAALQKTGEVVPVNTITRAPSAELKADQTDQDSLPPYEVLDAILEGLVERELSEHELISRGFEPETVKRISRLLYAAEYKREQSPPGVKISSKAFGSDRRYPITNRFVAAEHGFETGTS